MANRWLQIATLLVPLLALATERGSAENLPPSTERCGPVVATADSSAAEVAYGLARKAWTLDAYPEAVQFVVHVNVQNHGKNLLIHYRGEEEVRRGNIHVDRFSAEEMARPYVPHGINVYLTLGVSTGGATITGAGRQALTLLSKKLSPNEPTDDLLGTPHLSSAYSFGLLESATIAVPTVASQSNLKTIGKVSAIRRVYEIRCEPTTVDDGDAIHLSLRPTSDPGRYRLRELWIDPLNFTTRKIRTAGNFRDGPPLHSDWLTTFTTIGGAMFVDKEIALSPLDYGRGKRYENVTISFDRVEPLPRATVRLLIPQWPNEADLREP